ncbi:MULTISPECIES: alpha-amylase family protein [unclassified Modestobacter]|uniref:alpha-amylase family protein n=1 Tax=unclassified Modestobacter TaxID=2643866 RepID=UPI0022AABC1A|nr:MULTISPECIES: alpha-amylase family protein [unclassified Modestobacter]MCZ2812767.1 alpha-amylase family protein [Modestobacter sp. VKM Ac-2979]MCZ2843204.1 alpha-amylase family protein [Modestobacter sp. VKM Ac-2980]MCZ2851004.1 alpha-amylase family protein [Modestobacter sp. VKM Ac-2978]
MRITDTSDLWWKNAVVYCLDVETFMDWNDDGVGDLEGLAQRLDHLADLGVTCLWLMPFYPTAGRDDGYDITDYYGVDPRLGTHGDLVEMIRTAKDRGMRVIADLVVNHTSDQHPWFQSAKASKDSPYRDFYVWRAEEPPDTSDQVVFPDAEGGIWTHSPETGEWYLHRFYSEQPDLDVTNPRVRDEIAKIMGFWLELGLSGFRVDAVPFLLETDGVDEDDAAHFPDPHEYLRALRAFLGRRTGSGVLLGEVNLPFEQQAEFFGGQDGDELTMQFDFNTMQQMYLSLARGDAGPLAASLAARPAISPDSQWGTFVRNHDELTLDKLGDDERAEVFAAFGPDPEMQVYDRGLIRRLPPMLAGDPRRVRMVYSLLFSLPGTPVLFYGEEIGMGEDLSAGSRLSVRTPMQWTGGANGGFSEAPADQLTRPVVDGGFAPEFVNVADQRRDPDSLLSFMKLLIRRYRESPELGWGGFQLLDQPHAAVLAHLCTWDDGALVAVHNLGPDPLTVPLTVPGCGAGHRLEDLLTAGGEQLAEDGSVELALEGYGYRWLRLVAEDSRRLL